jgi:hypothetical protein
MAYPSRAQQGFQAVALGPFRDLHIQKERQEFPITHNFPWQDPYLIGVNTPSPEGSRGFQGEWSYQRLKQLVYFPA